MLQLTFYYVVWDAAKYHLKHRRALHVKEFLQYFPLDVLEVVVLVLTFRSVVHFELIIVYIV